MKRKHILFGLGVAAAGAAALAQLVPQPATVSDSTRPGVSNADKANPASERFAALPLREAIGKAQGQLFGPRSWAPPPSPVRERAAHVPEQPAAPPNPYRIAGLVADDAGMRVVLSKGERVFEVRQGDTLEEGLRVESIEPHAVTFAYVPLGITQELPVAGVGLDVPRPARSVAAALHPGAQAGAQPAPQPGQDSARTAQLRFEGPREVRAGRPFDVALKLTSPQPVRAVPMQLSFDAKRLEPVAVRGGDLFAGGSFTYRVNPGGSIFVGASGSGRAAVDTDFLIVTFRPIASGAAELKVSSLLLEGSAGRAIEHEPPQAFRAAIVQ